MKITAFSLTNSQAVEKFLIEHEPYAVNLTADFLEKKSEIYLIEDERGTLSGVFDMSSGGQIRHCIPVYDREKIRETGLALIDFFEKNRKRKLFSIVGEKTGCEIMRRAVQLKTSWKEKSSQEYVLLENDSPEAVLPETEEGTEFYECSVKDARELFPLQKNYELEEVYYNKKDFKSSVCLFNLEKSLSRNFTAALRFDGKIVSKGSVNATGKNYVQFGGIFTSREFRNHGFAEKIVRYMLHKFSAENKKCVLFVKIQNQPAISLYKKCGFKEISKFEIIYY